MEQYKPPGAKLNTFEDDREENLWQIAFIAATKVSNSWSFLVIAIASIKSYPKYDSALIVPLVTFVLASWVVCLAVTATYGMATAYILKKYGLLTRRNLIASAFCFSVIIFVIASTKDYVIGSGFSLIALAYSVPISWVASKMLTKVST